MDKGIIEAAIDALTNGAIAVASKCDGGEAFSGKLPARPCKRCGGKGEISYSFSNEPSPCHGCKRLKLIPQPNWRALIARCLSFRGAVRWRTSNPGNSKGADVHHRDAYLWRMVRFHGGADVTMPMMVGLLCDHDPWLSELDLFARAVAGILYPGSRGDAGGTRWRGLLCTPTKPEEIDGMPLTAEPNGPVITEAETYGDD